MGLSPRAWVPEAKILIGGGGGCEGAGFQWGLGARSVWGGVQWGGSSVGLSLVSFLWAFG